MSIFRIDSPRLGRIGSRAAERLLALPALNDLYRYISMAPVTGHARGRSFSERALEALDVEMVVSDTDLARIPARGPLVVVANHPFGGVDGLALLELLQRVRPDVKLLANRLLAGVRDLRENLLLVNAFDAAPDENHSAVRAALRWVRDGGVLGVFPAGEVSHWSLRSRTIADGPWSTTAARIARRTGAAVLPVFFEGHNSTLFQVAGLVHPHLRTALLPRELLKRRGSRLTVHIGSAIPAERLSRFEEATEATDYLRVRSYVLMGRPHSNGRHGYSLKTNQAAIAPPESAEEMATEISRLPREQMLASARHCQVFVAATPQIPTTLREIGRLREVTYRLVGEGTGRATDLDHYDADYRHLFVWNCAQREIVGAYRLGLTDEILPRFGRDGLYTSTLFHYRRQLLEQLTPAIELGRSFVRVEYQKEYLPLMLLWKGIGHFVAANPRYRMLFGPVSISGDYTSLTKQILMSFLKCNTYLPSMARLITPRNAPNFGPPRGAETAIAARVAGSIEEVDELVAEIEQDRRRVPVLLRQYLKLGAKLLGFNVDPDFGDVLDGLMLVDLLNVHPAILTRYMGAENFAAFRAFHHA
jgi:putative hemolysin